MTKENIRKIVEFKKLQEQKNTEFIYTIIKHKGKCSPGEIKTIMDRVIRDEAEENFHKGIISNIKKYIKDNSIRRETIQRKLKKMIEDGAIIKQGSNYSISDLALSDSRVFNPKSGKEYGNLLLNDLLMSIYPTIEDLKANIEKLVVRFGFWIICLLIESCKPINFHADDPYTENKTKDNVTRRWLEQAISCDKILDTFLSIVNNQYSEEQRKVYFERHYKKINDDQGSFEYLDNPPDHINDPMSANDFVQIRFQNMISDIGNIRYRTKRNPMYELKQGLINEIIDVLKDAYPDLYSHTSFTRSLGFRKSKTGSVDTLKGM